jgi:hypothetical protein
MADHRSLRVLGLSLGAVTAMVVLVAAVTVSQGIRSESTSPAIAALMD